MTDAQSIDGSAIQGSIRTTPLRRSYATTVDGRQWTRYKHSDWTEVTHSVPETALLPAGKSSAQAESNAIHRQLLLVLIHQLENEPNHWALYATEEGSSTGDVFQVDGDHTDMHHAFVANANLLANPDVPVNVVYTMASELTPEQFGRLKFWTERVSVPRAHNVAAIRANCQTWVIDVLEKLSEEQIVAAEKVREARSYREPLPYEL